MSQHAILAPSGAETWMNCVGSAAMQKGLPDDSNEYSDEGTAAHLLGSESLEKGCDPHTFVGQVIYVGHSHIADFDGATWKLPSDYDFEIRRKYTVDQEMADQVAKYVNKVRECAQNAALLMPEQRISIEKFTGEKGARGTSDAAVVLPGELQVHDLKFGMGVRVDAERNKQLMIYALGVREELELTYGPFETIRLVIHQPRLDHLSEWDCSSEELDRFAEEVKEKAGKALWLTQYSPDQITGLDLAPGEDTCRWCKAKPTCPALRQFVVNATAMDFEAADAKPVVPQDYGAFRAAFPKIGLVEDWCKAMRAYGEAQLFEHQNSPEIQQALGIKLVEGKKGNRAWTDEEKAAALLKQMRLPVEQRYKMTLQSPPAIEKILKATPRRWQRVLEAELIGQKDGKPSVALLTDKRTPWTPPDTSADFTAMEEEESIV